VRDGEVSADAADFSDQNCHAVAGIGHPSRFFSHLRSLGLSVVEHAFADHYAFTPQDLQFNDSAAILMTEKDAVKCRAFAPPESWFLRVDAALDNVFGEIILERLRELENGRKTA